MSGGRPFRESSDSYAKTGIPCGNPRRFHSHDVVRMEAGQRVGPRPQRPLDGPVEDIETEGQRQLQALLQKQLNTDVSLQQQLRQRKEFTRGAEFQASMDEMSGARSLADYQVQEKMDRYIEEMRGYGLTLEEILYKIQSDDDIAGTSKKSRLANPEFHAAKLQEINDKIEAKKQSLQLPDTFSGGKTLTRHEMELEKTLAKTNDANNFLHKVLIHDQHKDTRSDGTDPMRDLPNLLDKVTGKTCRRRKQSQRKQRQAEYKSTCTMECCVPGDTISNCAHEHGDNGDQLESLTQSSLIQTCAEKPTDYIPSSDDKTSSKSVDTKLNKKEKSVKSTSFTVRTVQSSGQCDSVVVKLGADGVSDADGLAGIRELDADSVSDADGLAGIRELDADSVSDAGGLAGIRELDADGVSDAGGLAGIRELDADGVSDAGGLAGIRELDADGVSDADGLAGIRELDADSVSDADGLAGIRELDADSVSDAGGLAGIRELDADGVSDAGGLAGIRELDADGVSDADGLAGIRELDADSVSDADGLAGIRELDEAVEAVPAEVIKQYRLSADDVRRLPRFQSYQPGEPTNVLYVKNLSGKVTEADLASLFIQYQRDESNKIVFKLLTGRMKGQAFVTFNNITTATEALELVHGYEFKGKPIILQYGKQSTVPCVN